VFEPLTVQMQSGKLVLWAKVEVSGGLVEYDVWVGFTGFDMLDSKHRKYVGTVQWEGLVYHVFH